MLTSIYTVSLLSANIFANRIGDFFNLTVAGNPLTYVICFFICDYINEFKGEKEARSLVNRGFLALLLFLVFLYSTYLIPCVDNDFEQSFLNVFDNSFRVVLGSLIAYFISNHIDITIFQFLKRKNKGRLTRKTLSTIFSQFIDSLVFCCIAFIGVIEAKTLIVLILSEYIIKTIINFLDLPFYYYVVRRKLK